MIRINLLPHRKKRAARSSSGSDKSVLIGLGAIIGLMALVVFLVHLPLANEISNLQDRNKKIKKENDAIAKEIKELGALRKAIKRAQEDREAIKQLNAARATPAWFLYELSHILTRGGTPSITKRMARELDLNPHRKWQAGWDPKSVWISKITEKKGAFSIEGNAQSETDVTQLAKRLTASMYMDSVKPGPLTRATDRNTGTSYFKFKITGRTRY